MRIYGFFLIFVLIFSGCKSITDQKKPPVVKNGILDLRGWDLESDGTVALRGEWEFYWDRLLGPQDFTAGPGKRIAPKYLEVPGLWTDHDYPANGFATYRIRILLDKPEQLLSLKISDVYASYKLYADSNQIATCGVVARNGIGGKDQVIPQVADIRLPTRENRFDLILQIANHSMLESGIPQVIQIGERNQIHRLRDAGIAKDLFLIGSILIMALYHLGLFGLRRKYRPPLYFALFSFGAVFYTALTGESFLFFLFPQLDVVDLFRVLLLALFSIMVFLTMFMREIYPNEFSLKVVRFYQILTGLGTVIVLVAPPHFYVLLHPVFHIFFIISLLYTVFALLLAVYHGRTGSLSMLIGFTIWALMILNDILYYYLIIDTANLASFGLLIFVFSQAFLLSIRFNTAFNLVESMSAKLEESNKQLSRLDRIKDEFLSNTSHELRTPLNGIIGLAQSLMEGVSGRLPESAIKNLSLIEHSGRRLSNLINDILDFSMLKNNEISLNKKPIDIREQVDVVFTIIRPVAEQKHLTLAVDIPDSIAMVNADENRLSQIFYNLIGNAIKFTESGTITVKAVAGVNTVEIEVSDTGIGIPEEEQSDIFKSFEQVDGWSARNEEGAGLGLSITRNLVELHGGHIWVESTVGKGSSFKFTIPKQAIDERLPLPGEPEAKKTSSPIRHSPVSIKLSDYAQIEAEVPAGKEGGHDPELANTTVLAVDDDAVNLQVIRNTLSLAGAEVMIAESGKECLDKLAEATPDIILLDIMMPGMNGFRTAKKIRNHHSFEVLPIIFLTAKGNSTNIVEGFNHGGNDYITKPFSKDELIKRIQFHRHLQVSRKNLVKAEMKYRRIFERAVEGIFQADKAGMIIGLNNSMATIFGFQSPDEVTANRLGLQDLFTEEEDKNQVQKLIDGEISILKCDSWFLKKTGSRFWGSTIMQIVSDRSEDNIHLEGIVLDTNDRRLREIAERKKEVAEEANRAKSEFLTSVTHELRTPLQAILGFSKLAVSKPEKMSESKVFDYFEQIYQSGLRLLSLVNNILDLARYEQKAVEYVFRHEKLSVVADYAARELAPLAGEKKIQIMLNRPEFQDTVELDVNKICQVIINLLANAIKFSDENGAISIDIANQQNGMTLSITDNGIGIPEEELDLVFDKFNQSSKTKRKIDGTGLGLAISKQIILGHKGTIWAESNPDGGTVFRFRIPVKQQA